MKKLISIRMWGIMMLCILSGALVWAQNPKAKSKTPAAKMDMDSSLPYKATYSSNFTMGDPALSKIILGLWKDWDDNKFEKAASFFADTITMYFPNGQMAKGRDSVIAGGVKYRGSLASAKSMVHAWIPLKSVDMNENWVAIWGTEEDTWKDGKKTVTTLNEVWQFNKDCKMDLMRQFESKVPPPNK